MRRLLILVILGALALPAPPAAAQVYPERIRSVTRTVVQPRVERYQREGLRATETERITRTVRIGESGDLDVSNIAGDVTITRGGGSDVVIDAVKTSRARTGEEAKVALELVRVEIIERPGRVEARTRYPHTDERRRSWRNLSVSVAYTITAPAGTRVTVNSVSGTIQVRDLTGILALETISGDVRIANAGRVSKAKTASGNVEIVDSTMEGMLDASTISGSVLVRNVKARGLDVGSISGEVVLEGVACERMDAQSISGTIRFSGPLVRGARYDFGSHSGEVLVAVSGDVGFELEASTFSGNLRTDVQLKLAGVGGRGGRGQRSIRGTYGDGSAFLDLTTFSGNVVLTRR